MTTQPLKLSALALVLLLAGDARAQGDLDLLTTSFTPPNVMILLDNSGSMDYALWDKNFNPYVFHDTGIVTGSNPGCRTGKYDISSVPTIANSAGICPGSGSADDSCPDSEDNIDVGWWFSGDRIRCRGIPGGCNAAPAGLWRDSCKNTGTDTQDFYLPDYTPGTDKTGWSKNYLNWFFTQLLMGNTPDIPAEDRLTAAKRATKTLIDNVNPDKTGGYEQRVRFGITTFDTSSSANGGIVRVPIGPGNKGSLMSYIDSIGANGWTPLSEALVDIGRYFAGTNRLGSYAQYDRQDNSGSVPPSPIDNSCRKNFVVIVTDGSPTQDLNNHHGSSVSGKTYDSHFGDTIGNSDADSNEDPDAISGRTTSFFTPPYRSNGTDWLDDVAYYLKNTDLDPIIDGAGPDVTTPPPMRTPSPCSSASLSRRSSSAQRPSRPPRCPRVARPSERSFTRHSSRRGPPTPSGRVTSRPIGSRPTSWC
jgi:hypothetical protein